MNEQKKVLDLYGFKLTQLDNQWKMYTISTNFAADSVQYLTKQKETLMAKLNLTSSQVESLKTKYEAMDVATKGWTEESIRLKEQLDGAIITQLELQKSLDDTKKSIEGQITTLDTWSNRWKEINRMNEEGKGGAQLAILGALSDKWKSGTLTLGDVNAVAGIPGLAAGGTVMSPGNVMVGERGPEILSLQRGATVTPMSKAGNSGPMFRDIIIYGNVGVDNIAEEIVDAIRRKTGANY